MLQNNGASSILCTLAWQLFYAISHKSVHIFVSVQCSYTGCMQTSTHIFAVSFNIGMVCNYEIRVHFVPLTSKHAPMSSYVSCSCVWVCVLSSLCKQHFDVHSFVILQYSKYYNAMLQLLFASSFYCKELLQVLCNSFENWITVKGEREGGGGSAFQSIPITEVTTCHAHRNIIQSEEEVENNRKSS